MGRPHPGDLDGVVRARRPKRLPVLLSVVEVRAVLQELEVPAVLRSGDHGAIARWRFDQQQQRTAERRPDLFARWQAQQQLQQ